MIQEPFLGWIAHTDKESKAKLDAQRDWYGFLKNRNCSMDGQPGWRLVYYPITHDNKTKEQYPEPRALVQKQIVGGIDFREVPLRYLSI